MQHGKCQIKGFRYNRKPLRQQNTIFVPTEKEKLQRREGKIFTRTKNMEESSKK